eukprot:10367542-Alexandrium_andersonii.AAC.1
MKEKIIVHENVPAFGTAPLTRHLGSLYIVIRLVTTPSTLGWPSERPRQICILFLRDWVFGLLRDLPRMSPTLRVTIHRVVHVSPTQRCPCIRPAC